MAERFTPGPHQVRADYRDKLTPGCDLAIVDEFLERYLAVIDEARAEALRLERLHDTVPELLAAHAVPSTICAERPAHNAARAAIAKATTRAADTGEAS